jgi:hypothetical protein
MKKFHLRQKFSGGFLEVVFLGGNRDGILFSLEVFFRGDFNMIHYQIKNRFSCAYLFN